MTTLEPWPVAAPIRPTVSALRGAAGELRECAVIGLLALRARFAEQLLRATGPLGHLVNAAIFVPLFAHPATAGGAFLFYGASMLVAAARRSAGCEVTAISNAVLDRHDQSGACCLRLSTWPRRGAES